MSVAGVMVSIVAFQAVDPGSIPGRRIFIGGPNELKFLNVPQNATSDFVPMWMFNLYHNVYE